MLLPFIFILVGAFDKFGKDTISNKAQTFNTNEADQYLIHMIPIDNISLTSDGKTKENKKDNDVYTQIKPLLIGDSVMVDIGNNLKRKYPKLKSMAKSVVNSIRPRASLKINIDITINHQTKSYLS